MSGTETSQSFWPIMERTAIGFAAGGILFGLGALIVGDHSAATKAAVMVVASLLTFFAAYAAEEVLA